MAGDLKSASKASQFQNKIDQLGSLGTAITEFSFDLNVVETLVADFIENVKESIQQEDMPVTGSIEDITMSVDGNIITLYGSPVLLWQDRGVNGAEVKNYDTPYSYTDKQPPVQPLIDWIKRKNINLRDNEFFGGKPSPFADSDGDEKAIEQLAWAISKKIFKEGFKPRNIFRKHIPELVENIKKEVTTFTAANIKSMIVDRYNNDVLNKPYPKK